MAAAGRMSACKRGLLVKTRFSRRGMRRKRHIVVNIAFRHISPCFRMGKQFFDEFRVQQMAAFIDFNMPAERMSQKGQIADQIKDFMPHRFISVAQRGIVHDAILRKDNGVIQRPAFR